MRLFSRRWRWAWFVVSVAAFLTRFWALGAAPLLPREVDIALGALDAARSGAWPTVSNSPLLLVGDTVLFLLSGASEATARLIPAMAGVGVVLLPWLWRRTLGEVGALAASLLILLSPLALFAARRVDGASVAMLSIGLLVTVALQSDMSSRSRGLIMAGGVAMGLLSGPAFYDVLLSGAIVLVLGWTLHRTGFPSLDWRIWGGAGLVIAVLVSTAFGFRWSGWAGIFDGIAVWLTEWGGTRPAGALPLSLVGLYEPALLTLVITSVVLWVMDRQRHSMLLSLVLWGILAILLNAMRPGSTTAEISVVVLPLSIAAGLAVGHFLNTVLAVSGRWLGLYSLTAFVFWLPALASATQLADEPALLLLGLGVLIVLQILLGILFSLRLAMSYVWRGALLGVCSALLLIQISFAMGLAFVRSASPIEPAIGTTASPDLRHLIDMLNNLAVHQADRSDAFDIVVIERDAELSALLRWTLRDFDELQLQAGWPQDTAPAVIAPKSAQSLMPEGPEAWRGMSFVATTTYAGGIPRCQFAPLDCSTLLRWYLYRASSDLPSATDIVLWQHEDNTAR